MANVINGPVFWVLISVSIAADRGISQNVVSNSEYSESRKVRETKTKELVIAAIFPMTGSAGWTGGIGCLPAAEMALRHVNEKADLLPGYNLKMMYNDSKCLPGLGTSVMYDLLYNPPQKVMLLTGCSPVSTTVAEAAKMWNLIVLSYGSSSPALSNRKRFPTFFRTHPSQTLHNPTRVKLFEQYGWKQIAILQEVKEVFSTTVEDLERKLKVANITISTRQSFLIDPTDAVKNLKRQNARIIVGMFYDALATRVFCEVYKNGLFGKKYVWFIIGWYADNWYTQIDDTVNCTVDELRQAVEGHLTTEAVMLNQNMDRITDTGISAGQFVKAQTDYFMKTQKKTKDEIIGFPESPLAYDAIWALAFALNRTMNELAQNGSVLEDFNYENVYIKDKIYQQMRVTQFEGVSGPVSFSETGDRIAWVQIEQMINGTYKKIGFYDYQQKNLTWKEEVKWIGGKPPPDSTVIVPRLRVVSSGLFTAMSTIASLEIVACAGLLCFNILLGKRRIIAWSHPNLNNIVLVGIIISLLNVYLMGLDGGHESVTATVYPQLCQCRAWLLALGFSLSFGGMFSKVWRVHRLATKAKKESKESDSWKLYIIVFALVVVDCIILGVWQAMDPLRRDLEKFALRKPDDTDEDIMYEPMMEHCKSEHMNIWLGVMYGYKGLMLIIGIFLAYETRSMKIKQLNDSRFVGMSIYNVVVLCMITAPVTIIIGSQQDASFAFVALAIIFCGLISMGLMFVPKILHLKKYPEDGTDYPGNFDSFLTKEEGEKHQKLMQENEELKRQIAEKEARIKALNEKLQERMTERAKLAIALGEAPDPELQAKAVAKAPAAENTNNNSNVNGNGGRSSRASKSSRGSADDKLSLLEDDDVDATYQQNMQRDKSPRDAVKSDFGYNESAAVNSINNSIQNEPILNISQSQLTTNHPEHSQISLISDTGTMAVKQRSFGERENSEPYL